MKHDIEHEETAGAGPSTPSRSRKSSPTPRPSQSSLSRRHADLDLESEGTELGADRRDGASSSSSHPAIGGHQREKIRKFSVRLTRRTRESPSASPTDSVKTEEILVDANGNPRSASSSPTRNSARSLLTPRSSIGKDKDKGKGKAKAEAVEQRYDVSLEFPDLDLHAAAASGNVGLVHYALTHGQPVNSVMHGVQPLHAACAAGSEAVVRMLIDRGADVNAPRLPRRYTAITTSKRPTSPSVGFSGSTPLHFAAANGHSNIVRILLASGAQYDKQDKHGHTASSLAEAAGHSQVVNTFESWRTLLEEDRVKDTEKQEEEKKMEISSEPVDDKTSSAGRSSPGASAGPQVVGKDPPAKRTSRFWSRGSHQHDKSHSLKESSASHRPTLPSILEKAAHPFRNTPAASQTSPTSATQDDPVLRGRSHLAREDTFTSLASSTTSSTAQKHMSGASLFNLFRRTRDHSPSSASPSPPKRTSQPLPPEDLDIQIERLRRFSIEGRSTPNSDSYSNANRSISSIPIDDSSLRLSPSKPSATVSRSNSGVTFRSAIQQEQQEQEGTEIKEDLEAEAEPVSVDDSKGKQVSEVLSYADSDSTPSAPGYLAGQRQALKEKTALRIDTDTDTFLGDVAAFVDNPFLAMHGQPELSAAQETHSAQPSPARSTFSNRQSITATETQSSDHRPDSRGLDIGRSRGASLSSVASSIIALQQLDNKRTSVIPPVASISSSKDPRNPALLVGRQRSASSSSSAMSGALSTAGTTTTPPSTLGSQEEVKPQDRLNRKLSKRKAQQPTLLYEIPPSTNRRLSTQEEASQMAKEAEQGILRAVQSGGSTASLAEQLAAYGDSLFLEETLKYSPRPSVSHQDSADSNLTVTTQSSRPIPSVASEPLAALGSHRDIQSLRNMSRTSMPDDQMFVAQAPKSIPSINQIYENRAAAYRDKGLALRKVNPFVPAARHVSNPNVIENHWVLAGMPRSQNPILPSSLKAREHRSARRSASAIEARRLGSGTTTSGSLAVMDNSAASSPSSGERQLQSASALRRPKESPPKPLSGGSTGDRHRAVSSSTATTTSSRSTKDSGFTAPDQSSERTAARAATETYDGTRGSLTSQGRQHRWADIKLKSRFGRK